MNKIQVTRTALRGTMLGIMSVAVIAATLDGFAQSYAGLYDWGLQHGLRGWKAESFPLLVDVFILVGEIGLFLLALDSHKLRKSFLSWIDVLIPFATAATGWGVSLWFNVERIKTDDISTKVTYGIPPVTAMVGLLILLRTVHRYMTKFDDENSNTPDAGRVLVTREAAPEPLSRPETAGELPAGELEPEPVFVPEPRQERSPLATALSHATPEIHEVAEALLHAQEPANDVDESIARAMRHPKWNNAVKLYTESLDTPGKPLSQRDLAEALGMRNRQLATATIKFVKRERGME